LEEWLNASVRLIDARGYIYVGVCNPRLRLWGLLVGEMRGEWVVLSMAGGIFQFGRSGFGNKFVGGVDIVLWDLLMMEVMY